MEPRSELNPESAILHLLQPGERVALELPTVGAELRVTDRRLLVTAAGSVRLDIAYQDLRRIQFDIETDYPASMVIVPQHAWDEPQVLAIPPESLHRAAEVLAFVGERLSLSGVGTRRRSRQHDTGAR